MTDDINKRINYLEAIHEVTKLKYNYFEACDNNDVIKLKKCFSKNHVDIKYENFGEFRSIESMLKKYSQKSINSYQIESHYGKNPVFSHFKENLINAYWGLDYLLIDMNKKCYQRISGCYKDLYIFEENNWVIRETHFKKNLDQIYFFQDEILTLS